MALTVLFAAGGWAQYQGPLTRAFADLDLDCQLVRNCPPEAVDYIVYAPDSTVQDFTPYTRTKAVLSLWAGVEKIVGNTTLTQPLTRMVDPGLTQGMVEWVTGHVLRHHLGLDAQITGQHLGWVKKVPPLAQDRPVSLLGLGALGLACAEALTALGFPVTGWSRTAHTHSTIRCLSGPDGLRTCLSTGQITVLLLPNTPETENTLNRNSLAWMPRGAVVINPGRGTLIDDAALLAALNTGQIAHATLDVFRTEPLPQDHPYWAHPNVTVTPHIAAETRPDRAARVIAQNIARCDSGQPLLHLVDRTRGY